MSTTAAGTVPDVPPTRERADVRVAAPAGGLRGVLESSPFPILLVSLVGILLLTAFGPALVVGDTWLMLMAGREVVDHGLPQTETLTVLGSGSPWSTTSRPAISISQVSPTTSAGPKAVSSRMPTRETSRIGNGLDSSTPRSPPAGPATRASARSRLGVTSGTVPAAVVDIGGRRRLRWRAGTGRRRPAPGAHSPGVGE